MKPGPGQSGETEVNVSSVNAIPHLACNSDKRANDGRDERDGRIFGSQRLNQRAEEGAALVSQSGDLEREERRRVLAWSLRLGFVIDDMRLECAGLRFPLADVHPETGAVSARGRATGLGRGSGHRACGTSREAPSSQCT